MHNRHRAGYNCLLILPSLSPPSPPPSAFISFTNQKHNQIHLQPRTSAPKQQFPCLIRSWLFSLPLHVSTQTIPWILHSVHTSCCNAPLSRSWFEQLPGSSSGQFRRQTCIYFFPVSGFEYLSTFDRVRCNHQTGNVMASYLSKRKQQMWARMADRNELTEWWNIRMMCSAPGTLWGAHGKGLYGEHFNIKVQPITGIKHDLCSGWMPAGGPALAFCQSKMHPRKPVPAAVFQSTCTSVHTHYKCIQVLFI